MLALVTNDDGIDSPGLLALAEAALAAGHRVVVAAPATEASGASASITASDAGAVTAAGGQGSIRVERRELPGLEVPAYAVYSAPALVVLLAAHGSFGPGPELVLSGINRGANLGRAILHSGTVGAALTGGTSGARGLAVSLAVGLAGGRANWSRAGATAASLLPLLAVAEPGTVLNLNVPNTPGAGPSEIVEASLAPFGIVHTTVSERGEGLAHLSIADPPDGDPPGSDAALLATGVATVTAIVAVREADEPFLTSGA